VTITRWVAGFADPRAESPLESISRLGMHDHDLPAPESQVEIWVDGRLIGRVDFYWDEYRVIGEADGWGKYANDWRKFRDQKRKDAYYERAGAVVTRWDSDEAKDFAAVAARLREDLRRGAARPVSQRRWIARPTGPARCAPGGRCTDQLATTRRTRPDRAGCPGAFASIPARCGGTACEHDVCQRILASRVARAGPRVDGSPQRRGARRRDCSRSPTAITFRPSCAKPRAASNRAGCAPRPPSAGASRPATRRANCWPYYSFTTRS
jgi:hypothetical protein